MAAPICEKISAKKDEKDGDKVGRKRDIAESRFSLVPKIMRLACLFRIAEYSIVLICDEHLVVA